MKTSRWAGDKKSGICPRCGHERYDFHDGRYKNCLACGFETFWEGQIRQVRYATRHGVLDMTTDSLRRIVRYIENLYPVS